MNLPKDSLESEVLEILTNDDDLMPAAHLIDPLTTVKSEWDEHTLILKEEQLANMEITL